MKLKDIHIYRITHIENIPHILQYGITHKDSVNKNITYKNIGDLSLIDTRSKRVVGIDNGDYYSTNELTTITLGDFIPFYFGVRMPMLYVAQHGGNFVEQPTSPSDIIYLVCSLSKLVKSTPDFYFTDGHATDRLTSFYDKSKIDKLTEIVDWNAVKTSYWGGVENLDAKRKKQAELLVSRDVEPELIKGFACYDETAKVKLISFGVSEDKIKVFPSAYF